MLRIFTKVLLCVLAFCIILSSWPATGQGLLSGNVTDQINHESLPGAHVFLEGSDKATVSDRWEILDSQILLRVIIMLP